VEADLIQSAFWHRFTATAHSPIGLDPSAHGLRIMARRFEGFAENDLLHQDRRSKTPEWSAKDSAGRCSIILKDEGLPSISANGSTNLCQNHASPPPGSVAF